MKLKLDITHKHDECETCGPITYNKYELFLDGKLIATEKSDDHLGGDVEWSDSKYGILDWIVNNLAANGVDDYGPNEEWLLNAYFGDDIVINRYVINEDDD
jgi:hypothetical protein